MYKAIKTIFYTICSVGFILIFTIIIVRVFIADIFVIPSRSMEPTLIPGDVILVNKTIFGARLYTRYDFKKTEYKFESFRLKGLRKIVPGDVIAFNMPNNKNRIKFVINYVFCKRCVGIPGDIITLNNSEVRNNNTNLSFNKEKELSNYYDQNSFLRDIRAGKVAEFVEPYYNVPIYVPRKNDIIKINCKNILLYKLIIEYETNKKINIDIKNKKFLLGETLITLYRFKHNYYFMVGDNYKESYDSRYWGFVPEEYIIGVVSNVILSKDSCVNKLKWERFLKRIK